MISTPRLEAARAALDKARDEYLAAEREAIVLAAQQPSVLGDARLARAYLADHPSPRSGPPNQIGIGHE